MLGSYNDKYMETYILAKIEKLKVKNIKRLEKYLMLIFLFIDSSLEHVLNYQFLDFRNK